jgi:hypothetical protein
MHVADVDQGMLGANGIGAVTIAGQGQPNMGDVKAGIGGSATTGADSFVNRV